MDNRVIQITNDILERCAYLEDITSVLTQLQPVSHIKQSKSPIVWTGGIPGAIKEYKQSKRLEKLINEHIYKDKSFYLLAFEIVETTKNVVDKQVELQSVCSIDTPEYFDNARRIVLSSEGCFKAWYEYSPSMAQEELEKNANLFNTVKTIYDEFRRMSLPEDMNSYSVQDTQSNTDKSGCFGALLVILSLSISIIGMSIYGIVQIIS